MKKLTVAITGNLGSGKSTVCRFIEKQGYPVIYADLLAKSLYTGSPELKDRIIAEFGEGIYTEQGFNSSALASIVFNDEIKLYKLNAIIHPIVIAENERLMREALKNSSLVFHEAALIFEADMLKYFDFIVVVNAPEELAMNRVKESRGITEEEFVLRRDKQLPAEFKAKNADYVIENAGSIEDLEQETVKLLEYLNEQILRG